MEHGDVLGEALYNFAEGPRRISPALPRIFQTYRLHNRLVQGPSTLLPLGSAYLRAGQPALPPLPLPNTPSRILTPKLSDKCRICSLSPSPPAPWEPHRSAPFSSVSSLCLLLTPWTSLQCQGEDRALAKELLLRLCQAQENKVRSSRAKQGCSTKQPGAA